MPTASVQTDIFEPLARAQALARGMPKQRFIVVPQPVMGKTPTELRAYVDGNDPITGRPFMTEVFEALTRPLSADETEVIAFDRSTPLLCEPDSEDNLHERFLHENWTDKLPIVLPTEARVEAMLRGTSRDSYQIVGQMRPTGSLGIHGRKGRRQRSDGRCQTRILPGYPGPGVHAGQRSREHDQLGSSHGRRQRSHPRGDRHELGGRRDGTLQPRQRHHWSRLRDAVSERPGGSLPLHTYLGSQGNSYAYNSLCYAKNEARSPWDSFHVQHGFKREDSTVSVFSGCRPTAFSLGLREKH